MADTPQDIQLRRFVRPIGVTGLGTAQPGRTERRLLTLSDTFGGVLATGVSTDPATPPADLSYLTLASLAAQGLARDERDEGAEPTSSVESISSDADDESGSAAPEEDELRVRELLRDDSDASAGERDLRPTDLTVSDEPPRTVSDEAGDDDQSERQPTLTGPDDQGGHPAGDGPAAVPESNPEGSVSEQPRTVVEQSANVVDTPVAGRDQSGRDRRLEAKVSSPPVGPGPGQGSDSPTERGARDAVPTTVVHRGAPGSDESGTGTGEQAHPSTHTGASVRTHGNGHGGPPLTVTGPGMTEKSAETGAESVSESSAPRPHSRPTRSPGEGSNDDVVADRTVIRSDGRLNERVFDRLYEEVSRKMRLERDREGR